MLQTGVQQQSVEGKRSTFTLLFQQIT
uniref:Uncharacterized protein n=1 Tax=Anguilla anguilla TaxID=7936 RepID=A0A0E9U4M9_ANGAN